MFIFTVIDPGDKETSDWLLCVVTFSSTLVLIDQVAHREIHREIMMGNFVKATNQIYDFFHFRQSLQQSENPLHFVFCHMILYYQQHRIGMAGVFFPLLLNSKNHGYPKVSDSTSGNVLDSILQNNHLLALQGVSHRKKKIKQKHILVFPLFLLSISLKLIK